MHFDLHTYIHGCTTIWRAVFEISRWSDPQCQSNRSLACKYPKIRSPPGLCIFCLRSGKKFCFSCWKFLESRICYWIVQVSPESSDREVPERFNWSLKRLTTHVSYCWFKHPIWHWIIILTRTNISYGFFHKVFRRYPPRLKAADTKEIGSRN